MGGGGAVGSHTHHVSLVQVRSGQVSDAMRCSAVRCGGERSVTENGQKMG